MPLLRGKRKFLTTERAGEARGILLLRYLLLALALSALCGCAYYNTFYNAKVSYSTAEKLGKDIDRSKLPTSSQKPKYETAIAKCEQMLDLYPNSKYVDDALFLIGKCEFRLKEYRKSIRNFDNVLNNFPRSKFAEEALYLKSIAHLQLGEEQVALDTLRRLREGYPKSKFTAESLYQLGDTFAADENWDQALKYYQQYLQKYRKDKERKRVLFDSASIYHRLKQDDQVEALLEEFQKDTKKEDLEQVVRAKLLLAESLNDLGKSTEALKVLNSVEEQAALFEKRAEVLLLKGKIQLALGNEADALTVLGQVNEEFPKTEYETQSHYLVAQHAIEAKGPDEQVIRDELETATEQGLKGDFSDPVKRLRLEMSRYDKLMASLEEPDSTSWREAFALGQLLYLDLGKPELALQYYRMVLDNYPDCPEAPRAAYAIGYIEEDVLGDDDAAQAAYALLDERYPDSLQARGREGEEFLKPKPHTLNSQTVLARNRGLRQGGQAPGSPAFSPDEVARRPSLNPLRALRRGGPGATSPRDRAQR